MAADSITVKMYGKEIEIPRGGMSDDERLEMANAYQRVFSDDDGRREERAQRAGLIGAIALAVALAFGIGGRETAGKELEEWIRSMKTKKD